MPRGPFGPSGTRRLSGALTTGVPPSVSDVMRLLCPRCPSSPSAPPASSGASGGFSVSAAPAVAAVPAVSRAVRLGAPSVFAYRPRGPPFSRAVRAGAGPGAAEEKAS
ncbi:hypothetical protein GCM10022252_37200 [Streptosporangium oxazolinicum]|uniref:Uncharacterized protein n=1 Tax=Streptosporangium oxazolinicum TaxID=909287 RepID=A0ABP8AZ30_9ACTN